MKEFLSIKDSRLHIKYFIVLVLVAFAFSIAVRMIWVEQFSGVESFKWNNELMINTNDGYFFAEGARDIIKGTHEANDLSPMEQLLPKLTALLASILPISFETLILYMPAFFGSLLVVPIMLIGRVLKQDMIGFIAALLGGIAWSYYNRTMTGYYDTDLLVIVLPTFFIWGVLYALTYEDSDSFLIAPIFAIAAIGWHSGAIHIVNGVFFMTLVYTLIFERRNLYYYKFLSVLVLALTTLPILLKFISIVTLVIVFHFLKNKLTEKQVIVITIISALIYIIFGGGQWILGILNSAYVTRALNADDLNLSLHYFSVVNTVREAGHIPFETFANRISGHTITFLLSVVGYVLLVFRYKLFILTVPMVILGFFALQGGLRFTVFAVPFMAIGIAYLIFLVANIFKNIFADNFQTYAKYSFIAIATVAILYPNIIHIIGYKVPTVFNKQEVSVVDQLGKIAGREDYVISWWDYGYPLRYYADVKTLIDGGKHDGNVNFPVSFSLLNDQVSGANMSRLAVEYTERGFRENFTKNMEKMLEEYNQTDVNVFLKTLQSKEFQVPQKTRDVYLYLPERMMSILPTVDLFANLNLNTGKANPRSFFYTSSSFQESGETINLGNNVSIIKNQGKIKIGDKLIGINNFVVTEYDQNGVLHKNVQTVDKTSPLSIVFMKNYKRFLVLDNRMFNSTYIQLFVLENNDKDLYEPVILTPLVKVYKLKK